MINNLAPTLKDEFENRFLAFEISEEDDDSGLIPVLEFFLRGGVQLLPPTPENVEAGDCFRFVKPSVAQKSLDTAPMGQWQMKGKEAKSKEPRHHLPAAANNFFFAFIVQITSQNPFPSQTSCNPTRCWTPAMSSHSLRREQTNSKTRSSSATTIPYFTRCPRMPEIPS